MKQAFKLFPCSRELGRNAGRCKQALENPYFISISSFLQDKRSWERRFFALNISKNVQGIFRESVGMRIYRSHPAMIRPYPAPLNKCTLFNGKQITFLFLWTI